MGRYATVVVDPPWSLQPIGIKVPGHHYLPVQYRSMTLEEIADLPIPSVLAEDAWLFCWTVNKYLPATFEIVRGWGCRYVMTMTWHKSNGVQTPVTPMFNGEWVVVGKVGSPKWLDTKGFRTTNFWKSGAHSVKPEDFYDLLRRVSPDPRLDVFGRRAIAGFRSWGDQAPDGPAPPSHYQQVMPI